jgi:chitodextrinase
MRVSAKTLTRSALARALATVAVFAFGVAGAGAADADLTLQVSLAADRSDAQPLDGSTVRGEIYAFLTGTPGIHSVRFYLDNPKMSGAPTRLERGAPYDLGGGDETIANPVDTATLADGPHTLNAAVRFVDGRVVVVAAAFAVSNHESAPPDVEAPTTPVRIDVAHPADGQVDISWPASTDNVRVAGYGVYRDGALVDTAVDTRFTFKDLACGKTYAIGVDSFDDAGNRSAARIVSVSVPACAAPPPSTDVLSLSETSDRANSRALAGAVVAGSMYVFIPPVAGVSGVNFYLDDPGMSGAPKQFEQNAPYDFAGGTATAARAFDSKSLADGEHTITAALGLVGGGGTVVHAKFSVKNAQEAPSDTTAPTAPTQMKVVTATETSVSLAWTASTDNVGVKEYAVFVDSGFAASTSQASATVGQLACGKTYTVGVEAVDAAGNRSARTSSSVTTAACTVSVPPSTSATVFLSPSGSDANPCTASKPCRSVLRGYEAAALGGVVEIAAGKYPDQLLPGQSSKARTTAIADRVVFRPAAGATVSLGRLEINVPHIEFRDMSIAKWKARYNVDMPTSYAAGNLMFKNIKTHHFSFNAVQNVSIIGGEVGPNRNTETGDWPQDGIFIGAYPPDKHPPTNILIDGVYVHDIREPNADAHSDCIQFTAGVNVVIRNSRFRNCEHADMMIKGDQGPIENFLIENNYLDRTLSAYYSINLYETSRGCKNVVMRNNTALQNIRLDACSGGVLTGNIQSSMSSHTCSSATVKIDWNVYESGSSCGSNDRVAAITYADRANFDLRLTGTNSAAVNRGNPSSFPGFDMFGTTRPLGGAPDAGAHERG